MRSSESGSVFWCFFTSDGQRQNIIRKSEVKLATQKKYLSTLNTHLFPAFGSIRLCEISTFDLQRFVLAKMHSGLGWESCDLLRNLMSRVFNVAKTWNFYTGENPASGVMLLEKKPVREKHVLDQAQIQPLLDLCANLAEQWCCSAY
jgi:hypothetical protein